MDLVDASLAIADDLSKLGSVPTMVNWDRYLGSELINATSFEWVDNMNYRWHSMMLLKAVMIIVTSMNAENPHEFAELVGFEDICRCRRIQIYQLMEDSVRMTDRRRASRRMGFRSTSVEANIFSHRLHVFCPNQFGDFDSRRLIFKMRIAYEQYDKLLFGGVFPLRWTDQGKVQIITRREYAFQKAVDVLQHDDVGQLIHGVHIHFENELAEDYGGVTRDWITEIVKQVSGRFFSNKDGFDVIELSINETMIPSTAYQTIGKIFGLAIMEGIPIGLRFPLIYAGEILDQDIVLEDIVSEDPELYRTLAWILSATSQELDGMEIEIMSKSFPITIEDRTSLVHCKLNTPNIPIADHLDALKRGLLSVIPPKILNDKIFTPKELQAMIEGERDILIDDLWSHLDLVGYTAESIQIKWFWELLVFDADFDQPRLKLFVRFLTGLSQPPLGGFGKLERKLTFAKAPRNDPDSTLPSAHTCVYQLNLPEYSSKDIMKSKLIYAIESSPHMGFV
jgi:hypothetical protein